MIVISRNLLVQSTLGQSVEGLKVKLPIKNTGSDQNGIQDLFVPDILAILEGEFSPPC